jgi:CspA family cold shock protein
MALGTVKWFSSVKGYGFIAQHDEGEDLFVHFSELQMDGFRTLRGGQQVSFEVGEGDKGAHAVKVSVLKGASASL